MTNHIHVLVQVASTPLGKIILRIASKYARAFQRKLATTGHLFERRYHGILVEADRYLLTLVRYLHLNPVRAGLVADPCDYLWSSHRDYLGLARHDWLHTAFTLNALSANAPNARVAYSRLMGGPGESRWGSGTLVTHPDNPQVMGSDDFLKQLAATGGQSGKPVDLEVLVRECSSRFKLTDAELAGHSRARRLAAARAWLVHEALGRGVATVSAVARRLNRSEAALRGLMSRHPHEPGK
jgi:hypothetical protein